MIRWLYSDLVVILCFTAITGRNFYLLMCLVATSYLFSLQPNTVSVCPMGQIKFTCTVPGNVPQMPEFVDYDQQMPPGPRGPRGMQGATEPVVMFPGNEDDSAQKDTQYYF